jgi:hypothetical protein
MMKTKNTIVFCYRKIVDAASEKKWDQYVFESSYQEFRMQAQLYNQEKKYSSFSDLIQHVPAAEKLHFLVSGAITGYLAQLNNRVPDITDNLGRTFLSFTNYRFEIIQSNISDKAAHRVAINFFSDPMTWHDTIGQYMLVSSTTTGDTTGPVLTNLVPVQPFLGIHSCSEDGLVTL